MLKEEKFYISSTTLQELEHIKVSRNKDEETKYRARKVLHILDENTNKYEVVIVDKYVLDIIEDHGLENTPDNQICACATTKDCVFVTNDIACKTIAKWIFGLEVSSVSENGEEIYMGYQIIHGNTETINSIMENMDFSKWHTNEYLIIENTDDNSSKEMRFDGDHFVALKLPPSKYIKGKNSLQRCALDILNNPDITIAAILGGYGSGKTFLSMQMALYNVREKGYAIYLRRCFMPSIEYDDVYKRALTKINDLDLANYTEEDFKEYMKEWLHSSISKPYLRKKFSSFSFNDDFEEINFSLVDPVDDDYDSQFVISALAKGLIVNYFPSKLETTANLAVMIGGKEEKKLLDTYSKNIERLDKLRKEWELELSRHSYYFKEYGDSNG